MVAIALWFAAAVSLADETHIGKDRKSGETYRLPSGITGEIAGTKAFEFAKVIPKAINDFAADIGGELSYLEKVRHAVRNTTDYEKAVKSGVSQLSARYPSFFEANEKLVTQRADLLKFANNPSGLENLANRILLDMLTLYVQAFDEARTRYRPENLSFEALRIYEVARQFGLGSPPNAETDFYFNKIAKAANSRVPKAGDIAKIYEKIKTKTKLTSLEQDRMKAWAFAESQALSKADPKATDDAQAIYRLGLLSHSDPAYHPSDIPGFLKKEEGLRGARTQRFQSIPEKATHGAVIGLMEKNASAYRTWLAKANGPWTTFKELENEFGPDYALKRKGTLADVMKAAKSPTQGLANARHEIFRILSDEYIDVFNEAVSRLGSPNLLPLDVLYLSDRVHWSRIQHTHHFAKAMDGYLKAAGIQPARQWDWYRERGADGLTYSDRYHLSRWAREMAAAWSSHPILGQGFALLYVDLDSSQMADDIPGSFLEDRILGGGALKYALSTGAGTPVEGLNLLPPLKEGIAKGKINAHSDYLTKRKQYDEIAHRFSANSTTLQKSLRLLDEIDEGKLGLAKAKAALTPLAHYLSKTTLKDVGDPEAFARAKAEIRTNLLARYASHYTALMEQAKQGGWEDVEDLASLESRLGADEAEKKGYPRFDAGLKSLLQSQGFSALAKTKLASAHDREAMAHSLRWSSAAVDPQFSKAIGLLQKSAGKTPHAAPLDAVASFTKEDRARYNLLGMARNLKACPTEDEAWTSYRKRSSAPVTKGVRTSLDLEAPKLKELPEVGTDAVKTATLAANLDIVLETLTALEGVDLRRAGKDLKSGLNFGVEYQDKSIDWVKWVTLHDAWNMKNAIAKRIEAQVKELTGWDPAKVMSLPPDALLLLDRAARARGVNPPPDYFLTQLLWSLKGTKGPEAATAREQLTLYYKTQRFPDGKAERAQVSDSLLAVANHCAAPASDCPPTLSDSIALYMSMMADDFRGLKGLGKNDEGERNLTGVSQGAYWLACARREMGRMVAAHERRASFPHLAKTAVITAEPKLPFGPDLTDLVPELPMTSWKAPDSYAKGETLTQPHAPFLKNPEGASKKQREEIRKLNTAHLKEAFEILHDGKLSTNELTRIFGAFASKHKIDFSAVPKHDDVAKSRAYLDSPAGAGVVDQLRHALLGERFDAILSELPEIAQAKVTLALEKTQLGKNPSAIWGEEKWPQLRGYTSIRQILAKVKESPKHAKDGRRWIMEAFDNSTISAHPELRHLFALAAADLDRHTSELPLPLTGIYLDPVSAAAKETQTVKVSPKRLELVNDLEDFLASRGKKLDSRARGWLLDASGKGPFPSTYLDSTITAVRLIARHDPVALEKLVSLEEATRILGGKDALAKNPGIFHEIAPKIWSLPIIAESHLWGGYTPEAPEELGANRYRAKRALEILAKGPFSVNDVDAIFGSYLKETTHLDFKSLQTAFGVRSLWDLDETTEHNLGWADAHPKTLLRLRRDLHDTKVGLGPYLKRPVSPSEADFLKKLIDPTFASAFAKNKGLATRVYWSKLRQDEIHRAPMIQVLTSFSQHGVNADGVASVLNRMFPTDGDPARAKLSGARIKDAASVLGLFQSPKTLKRLDVAEKLKALNGGKDLSLEELDRFYGLYLAAKELPPPLLRTHYLKSYREGLTKHLETHLPGRVVRDGETFFYMAEFLRLADMYQERPKAAWEADPHLAAYAEFHRARLAEIELNRELSFRTGEAELAAIVSGQAHERRELRRILEELPAIDGPPTLDELDAAKESRDAISGEKLKNNGPEISIYIDYKKNKVEVYGVESYVKSILKHASADQRTKALGEPLKLNVRRIIPGEMSYEVHAKRDPAEYLMGLRAARAELLERLKGSSAVPFMDSGKLGRDGSDEDFTVLAITRVLTPINEYLFRTLPNHAGGDPQPGAHQQKAALLYEIAKTSKLAKDGYRRGEFNPWDFYKVKNEEEYIDYLEKLMDSDRFAPTTLMIHSPITGKLPREKVLHPPYIGAKKKEFESFYGKSKNLPTHIDLTLRLLVKHGYGKTLDIVPETMPTTVKKALDNLPETERKALEKRWENVKKTSDLIVLDAKIKEQQAYPIGPSSIPADFSKNTALVGDIAATIWANVRGKKMEDSTFFKLVAQAVLHQKEAGKLRQEASDLRESFYNEVLDGYWTSRSVNPSYLPTKNKEKLLSFAEPHRKLILAHAAERFRDTQALFKSANDLERAFQGEASEKMGEVELEKTMKHIEDAIAGYRGLYQGRLPGARWTAGGKEGVRVRAAELTDALRRLGSLVGADMQSFVLNPNLSEILSETLAADHHRHNYFQNLKVSARIGKNQAAIDFLESYDKFAKTKGPWNVDELEKTRELLREALGKAVDTSNPLAYDLAAIANVWEEMGFLERAKHDAKFRADFHKIRSGPYGNNVAYRYDPSVVRKKMDDAYVAHLTTCPESEASSVRCRAYRDFLERAAKSKQGVTSEARLLLLDPKTSHQDIASLEYLELVIPHLSDRPELESDMHKARDILRLLPHPVAISEQTKAFHPFLAEYHSSKGQSAALEKQVLEKLMKAATSGKAVSRRITVSFDKKGEESFDVGKATVRSCVDMKAKDTLSSKKHEFDIVVGVADIETLRQAEQQIRRIALLSAAHKAAEVLKSGKTGKGGENDVVGDDELKELISQYAKTEYERLYKEARRMAAIRLIETKLSPKLTLQDAIGRPFDPLGCALRALLGPDFTTEIELHERGLARKHITDHVGYKANADEYQKLKAKGAPISKELKEAHDYYHDPENAPLVKIVQSTDPEEKKALEEAYIQKHVADYEGTGNYFADYETWLANHLGVDHVAWQVPGEKQTAQQKELEKSFPRRGDAIGPGAIARKKANDHTPELLKCVDAQIALKEKGLVPQFNFKFPPNYEKRNKLLGDELQEMTAMLMGQQRLLALSSLEHGKAGKYAEERLQLRGQRQALQKAKEDLSKRPDAASVDSQTALKDIDSELADITSKIKDTARHEFVAKLTLEALLKRPLHGELSKEEEARNKQASEEIVALIDGELKKLRPKAGKADEVMKLGLIASPFASSEFLEKLIVNPQIVETVSGIMKAHLERAKKYYKDFGLPETPLPKDVTEAKMIERLSHLRARSLVVEIVETMRKARIEQEFQSLSGVLEKELGQQDQEHVGKFRALAIRCMGEINRKYDPEVKDTKKHIFTDLDAPKNGEVSEISRLLYTHLAQRKALEHLSSVLQPPPAIGLTEGGKEALKSGPWSSYASAKVHPATKHAVEQLKKLMSESDDSLKVPPAHLDKMFEQAFHEAAKNHREGGGFSKGVSVADLKEKVDRLKSLSMRWNGISLLVGDESKKSTDLALWKIATDATNPYHVLDKGKFSWRKSLEMLRSDLQGMAKYGRYASTGSDPWLELMGGLTQAYTRNGYASRFEFGHSLVIIKGSDGKELDSNALLNGSTLLDFLTDPRNAPNYLEFLNLDEQRLLAQRDADEFKSASEVFKHAANNYKGAANRLFGFVERTITGLPDILGYESLGTREKAFRESFAKLDEIAARLKARGAITVHTSIGTEYGPISAYRLARSYELERANLSGPEFEKTLLQAAKSIDANNQFWAETAIWEAATLPLHLLSGGLTKLASVVSWSNRAVKLVNLSARVLQGVKHGIHIADAFSVGGTAFNDLLVNQGFAPIGHYEVNSDQVQLLKSGRESRYIFISMPFVQQALGAFVGGVLRVPAHIVPFIAEPLGLYFSSVGVHTLVGGEPWHIAHRQSEHSLFIGFPWGRLFGSTFARTSLLRNSPYAQMFAAGLLTYAVFAGHDFVSQYSDFATEGKYVDPVTGKTLTGEEATLAIAKNSFAKGGVPNFYFAFLGARHAPTMTARSLLRRGEAPAEIQRIYGEKTLKHAMELLSAGEIRDLATRDNVRPLLDLLATEHGFENRHQFVDYMNKEITKIGKGILSFELGGQTTVGEAGRYAARQARIDLAEKAVLKGEAGFRELANHSLFFRPGENGQPGHFRPEALPQLPDSLVLNGLRSTDIPTLERAHAFLRTLAVVHGMSPANALRFGEFLTHYRLRPGESIASVARRFRWMTPERVRELVNSGRLSIQGLVDGFPDAAEAEALGLTGFTRDRALSAFTDAELGSFLTHANNPAHAQQAAHQQLVLAALGLPPGNVTGTRMWGQVISRDRTQMNDFIQSRGGSADHPATFAHIPTAGFNMDNPAHAAFVNSAVRFYDLGPGRPLAALQARVRAIIRNNPAVTNLRAAIDLAIAQTPP